MFRTGDTRAVGCVPGWKQSPQPLVAALSLSVVVSCGGWRAP